MQRSYRFLPSFLAELAGSKFHTLLKLVAEGSRIPKTTGICNLCYGVLWGMQHSGSGSQSQPHQILFGRDVFLLHKQAVQVRAVYADISSNIRNMDIVAVIIMDVINRFFQISLCVAAIF